MVTLFNCGEGHPKREVAVQRRIFGRRSSRAGGSALSWAAASVILALSLFLRHPFLSTLRPSATLLVLVAGGGGLVVILSRRPWRGPWPAGCLALLWFAGPSVAAAELLRFAAEQKIVLSATGPEARELGRHIMVGYRTVATVRPLAANGLIAGIFVSRRNVEGRTIEDLRREIAELQLLRRTVGLPPLLVATDQEGGPVSHLSPPLTALPPLAGLALIHAPAWRRLLAHAYGAFQGRELASIGVTVDFSPVVDLRRVYRPGLLDRRTRIADRAISADPDIVAEIAGAYARGLNEAGVLPTLKHFPGLGRVPVDTHLFAGQVVETTAELERQDWLPFRRIMEGAPVALMVGHVTIAALDPAHQASQSPVVIQGLLCRDWGFKGLIVSDDLTMGAVYHEGLCHSAIRALDAGMDLLLISYDDEQYFPAMACALRALSDGRLDLRMLAHTGVGANHAGS